MDKNENQEKKSMSVLAKLVIGASTLFGGGVGTLISGISQIAAVTVVVCAQQYGIYYDGPLELQPRRFIPKFIPRGFVPGAIVGGAVGYSTTVLFGKGYDYAKNAIQGMDKKQEQNKPRQ